MNTNMTKMSYKMHPISTLRVVENEIMNILILVFFRTDKVQNLVKSSLSSACTPAYTYTQSQTPLTHFVAGNNNLIIQ